ncbi:MAG: pantoate--beta-alanine ligase [Azospirillum sp.]|nr:pantoate--beta-alanine ligase [Azospirillum sp.]
MVAAQSGLRGVSPTVVRDPAALRAACAPWRRAGERIALVPTMGALHAGHISLVAAARAHGAARVIASIFVNPTQFGPNEDFAVYPRDEAGDLDALARAGADIAYLPDAAAMYPPGDATRVRVTGLTDCLCGPLRPGHFEGVATVVAKLFGQALPDLAMFGEKDYQQLLVVRRMAADLALTPAIVGVPTLREADGLAMSSRNRRLPAAARAAAPRLYGAMREAAARIAGGEAPPAPLAAALAELTRAGFDPVEYFELRDARTLAPAAAAPARLFAAAHLAGVRLIDNVAVG